ncbi:hypothetical protein B0H16DRAFT_1492503 [Mycena metata]|uniref:Uncharacterized protein n=1 Tax=Mycena metata TaxID=1033252 RepID=A0AAD7P260_9AGAR|nr:hypothetical protein B0H16DRAFT_1492503 [Mycena metata]
MPNSEQVVFDEELYARVNAATRFNAGLVLDKGAGIDASTLRGFFLHHLTREKPCYFTSSSAVSYMVDASGISTFPTDAFQTYHRYLPVLSYEQRPWSFFDILPGKVKVNGYGDALHERIAPPYLVHPSGQNFSLLLADPTKASPQYDSWRRKCVAPRWSTPADTLMYAKYLEKSSE